MTYDPGMCDTFTTMPPPYPGLKCTCTRRTAHTTECALAADDAILAGILRRAARSDDGVALWSAGDGGVSLSINKLRINRTEWDALQRAAGQPLP